MSAVPPPVLTEAEARPPRPGWAKALGVGHIVISTLTSVFLLISLFWVGIIAISKPVDGVVSSMMGMDDPRYLAFIVVDALTGVVVNGLMFASGLGLVNLRPWGARLWQWLAPVKIVRLVILWGWFIVGVAPGLSSSMGRAVVAMFQQWRPAGAKGRIPSVEELTLIYAWMCLAIGIAMMVLGSIYPAITWWLVRRKGIRSALVDPDFGSMGSDREPGPWMEAHSS